MKYLYTVILLLCCATTFAQTNYAITAYPFYKDAAYTPSALTVLNGQLYFVGNDSAHGYELWSVEENHAPIRLTDIHSDTADGIELFYVNTRLGVIGDYLFFSSKNGNWANLSRYNTRNSQLSLAALNIGLAQDFYTITNRLYFSIYSSPIYNKIEYFDTGSNTKKSANGLSSAKRPSDSNAVVLMASVGNNLYFRDNTTDSTNTLWEYDAIANKTNIVADNSVQNGNITHVTHLLPVGNTLYFVGKTAAYGYELYSYKKGLPPTRLTDNGPGAGESITSTIFHHNGYIYFSGSDANYKGALFRYEIATSKTEHVKDALGPTFTPAGNTPYYPTEFTLYKDKIFFSAINATNDHEIGVYDPAAQSGYVIDVVQGQTKSSKPRQFKVLNNTLFFTGVDSNGNPNVLFKYKEYAASVTNTNLAITNISAYPNPTSADAQLSMTLKQAATLRVLLTDINGRVVYRSDEQLYSKGKHNITLPMQRLSSGTYIYTVLDNSGQLLNSGRVLRK